MNETTKIRYVIEYQPGTSLMWHQSLSTGTYRTPEQAMAAMESLPLVTPRLGKAMKYRVVKVTEIRGAI